MSMSAALIILAIAGVMAAFIAAEYLSRRPKKAADPQCSLETACKHYLENPDKWSARDRLAIESISTDLSGTREKLTESLSATVEESLASPEPTAVLREAIMDATDRFVMAETLYQPDDDGEDVSETGPGGDAVSVLEAGALRCFSMLRFADYAEEDWYQHYLNVSEMSSRNVAAMVQKAVSGAEPALEASLHDPLTVAMREARLTLLHHPPQTPVSRGTRLAHGQSTTMRTPTQKQIDRLSDIMAQRFERLFTGQGYRLGDTPLDPAGAVEVDAALLYTTLALGFRQPAEAWRRILVRSLGGYGDVMQSEEKLLEVAKAAHQGWQQHKGESRLNAALTAACGIAFDEATATAAGGPGGLAAGILEEASVLVGSIQQATRDND